MQASKLTLSQRRPSTATRSAVAFRSKLLHSLSPETVSLPSLASNVPCAWRHVRTAVSATSLAPVDFLLRRHHHGLLVNSAVSGQQTPSMVFPWIALLATVVGGAQSDFEDFLALHGHLIPLTTLSHGHGEAIVAYKATVDVGQCLAFACLHARACDMLTGSLTSTLHRNACATSVYYPGHWIFSLGSGLARLPDPGAAALHRGSRWLHPRSV